MNNPATDVRPEALIEVETELRFGDLLRAVTPVVLHIDALARTLVTIGAVLVGMTVLLHQGNYLPDATIWHVWHLVLYLGLGLPVIRLGAALYGTLRLWRGTHSSLRYGAWRLSSDRVEWVSGGGEWRAGWGVFEAVEETRSAFVFHPFSSISSVLPKRCFRDADQVAACRELIRRKLGAKARLRKK